jgi:hypothetical protein
MNDDTCMLLSSQKPETTLYDSLFFRTHGLEHFSFSFFWKHRRVVIHCNREKRLNPIQIHLSYKDQIWEMGPRVSHHRAFLWQNILENPYFLVRPICSSVRLKCWRLYICLGVAIEKQNFLFHLVVCDVAKVIVHLLQHPGQNVETQYLCVKLFFRGKWTPDENKLVLMRLPIYGQERRRPVGVSA